MDNNYMNDNSDNVVTENKKKKGYFSYLIKTVLFAIGIYVILFVISLIFGIMGINEARELILRFSVIIPMFGIILSPAIAAIFYYTQK